MRPSVGADPIPGESLPGFIARLAGLGRFTGADRLAAMAGLRQPGSAVTAADFGPLVSLTGTSADLLRDASYAPDGPGRQRFLGGHVNREFLVLSPRRVCPACLAEAPYHRAAWDFALLTACPLHELVLVDRCPACRNRLGWRAPSVTHCCCGADLRRAPCPVAATGEADDCKDLISMVSGTAAWLPPALGRCPGHELPRLLMCLGMFVTGWKGQRRVEALLASGPSRVAAVSAAGLDAFRGWPAPIHAQLDERRTHANGRRGRYGARKSLGAFYDWVTGMEQGAVKEALADALSSFVAGDPDLLRRTHRSALIARPENAPVAGLKEAASLLGVSGEGVKKLMASGLLPMSGSEGRGVPMLIARDSVQELAATFEGCVDLAGAASLLGISRKRVRLLAEAGTLHPLKRGAADGFARWSFAIAEMELLLAGLQGQAVDGDVRGKTVGFEHAAEAFRRRGIELPSLLAMITGGQLQVVQLAAADPGLKRLRFLADDIRSGCRRLEEGAPLSIQAAAERLGLKWEVVANLIAHGHLVARDGFLEASAVAAFASAHVTGAALAKERGTSPRALAARLAARGVLPVAGPGIDGSRQNLFRTADLD